MQQFFVINCGLLLYYVCFIVCFVNNYMSDYRSLVICADGLKNKIVRFVVYSSERGTDEQNKQTKQEKNQ